MPVKGCAAEEHDQTNAECICFRGMQLDLIRPAFVVMRASHGAANSAESGFCFLQLYPDMQAATNLRDAFAAFKRAKAKAAPVELTAATFDVPITFHFYEPTTFGYLDVLDEILEDDGGEGYLVISPEDKAYEEVWGMDGGAVATVLDGVQVRGDKLYLVASDKHVGGDWESQGLLLKDVESRFKANRIAPKVPA